MLVEHVLQLVHQDKALIPPVNGLRSFPSRHVPVHLFKGRLITQVDGARFSTFVQLERESGRYRSVITHYAARHGFYDHFLLLLLLLLLLVLLFFPRHLVYSLILVILCISVEGAPANKGGALSTLWFL
ncbi:hypothetical protein HDV63DRAFT_362071, partial [Trichoderma sp. SZMC 28014]